MGKSHLGENPTVELPAHLLKKKPPPKKKLQKTTRLPSSDDNKKKPPPLSNHSGFWSLAVEKQI
jgi:hypothetical protein